MTLTPKEKAKELVGKYVKFKLNGLFKFFGLELSKQCAIIAVDEIIKALIQPFKIIWSIFDHHAHKIYNNK